MSGSGPDAHAGQLARASALCDLGRFDQASSMLAPLLASNPESARAWCLRARAAIGLGDDAGALHAAKSAIALTPEEEWPHRLASIALNRSFEHEAAIWHAREAVRLAPHEWRGYTNLARTLAPHVNGRAEAQRAAEHAIELAPHEVESHLAAGAAAAAAGRRDDADASYRRALALDPQSSAAHNELTRLHLRKATLASPASLAQAATGFETAVRADPHGAVSRRNLDLVLSGFLSWTAYLVFVGAFVAFELAQSGHATSTRWVALTAVAVPALFAARFVGRLTDPLRRHLTALVARNRAISVAVGAELLALGLLAAAAIAPATGSGLAGGACALALISRVVLASSRQRSAKR